MQLKSTRMAGLAAAFAAALVISACGDDGATVTDELQDGAGTVTDTLGGDEETTEGAEDETQQDAEGGEGAETESESVMAADGTEVVLEGELAEKYAELGPELGALTGEPQTIGDGTAAEFENGTIYWSEETGAHLVQGEILRVYTESGGPEGELGFPTSDEDETDGGWESEFENGTITWTDQGDGMFAEDISMS
ncbi:LGFP repeat-containing protein [Hoyosella altamirensis]|uniref:Uncharacterized protein with LGFP repeats n=1 Tax=Hoyosella altamirensis TaxID=616997 RepID=A0A839RQ53_9ACTN|nr:hypothetical protein [Hoyosella altamirensis]MBB3038527.1 uncharacterized protein with LGFP repeats [Hoyosella altamirensis]